MSDLIEKTDSKYDNELQKWLAELVEAVRDKDDGRQQVAEHKIKPLIGAVHETDHEGLIDWIFLKVKAKILVDIIHGRI